MSRLHVLTLVTLCLVFVICTAGSVEAARSISLQVDRNGVLNDGTDSITFSWIIDFDTTCSQDYVLEVVGPGGTEVLETFPCEPSPITDSFEWLVPAGVDSGIYTTTLTFFSHWEGDDLCSEADFVDSAEVQFEVCGAGRFRVCKFNDLEGNGVKDPDDPPLEGWEFTITGALLPQPIVVFTGPDGCTEEIIVPVGPGGSATYSVEETLQPGWIQTTPPTNPVDVVIVAGPNPDVEFGNWCPATFKVCKFNDLNGDGQKDPGDPPLEGWEFTITGTLLPQPIVVVTGSDGCTEEIVVPTDEQGMATYLVEETLQPGWEQTTPATNPFEIEVVCGQNPDVEFGDWQPVLITGFKLFDKAPWPWSSGLNPPAFEPMPSCPQPIPPLPCVSPMQPDQEGIGGVVINLFDETGIILLATTGTAPDGFYAFGPLQWREKFVIEEENPDAVPPECDTVPADCGLNPWLGAFANTVATSVWPCPNIDFATPDTLAITLTPPVTPGQEYGCNYFFNWQPSRLWGQICETTLEQQAGPNPPLPNTTIVVEKDGVPWPAGNPSWDPITGCYQLATLVQEPEGLRSGTYRLTPPAPINPAEFEWDVTLYCSEVCTDDVQTFELAPEGFVDVVVPTGCDIRVDFCLRTIEPNGDGRRCYLPVTFKQDGWSFFCDPTNPIIPGGMVFGKFSSAFRNYVFFGTPFMNRLIVGQPTRNTISYEGTTSCLTRLCLFLPQTADCGRLVWSHDCPWKPTDAGVLAGEVIALLMNIAYNDRRLMPRSPGYDLEDFVVAQGLLRGRTVGEVFNMANAILAGEPPTANGVPNCEAMVEILQNINANYEFVDFDTFTDNGYLIPNRSLGPPDPPHDPVVPF